MHDVQCESAALHVREATAADACSLIRLIRNVYGEQYYFRQMYDETVLQAAIESRKKIILLVETAAGRIVCCGVLHVQMPQLIELGTMMTEPEYRSSCALTLLVKAFYRLLRQPQYSGKQMHAFFVTQHIQSQRIMDVLKMTPVGLYLSLHEPDSSIANRQRESCVLAVRRTTEVMQTINLPAEHRGIGGELLRQVGVTAVWNPELQDISELRTCLHKIESDDGRLLTLRVEQCGADLAEVISAKAVAAEYPMCRTCIALFALEQPLPAGLDQAMKRSGYFFSGLQLRKDGVWYSHYTCLLEQAFDFSQLRLHGSLTERLRDYVQAQYRQVQQCDKVV